MTEKLEKGPSSSNPSLEELAAAQVLEGDSQVHRSSAGWYPCGSKLNKANFVWVQMHSDFEKFMQMK